MITAVRRHTRGRYLVDVTNFADVYTAQVWVPCGAHAHSVCAGSGVPIPRGARCYRPPKGKRNSGMRALASWMAEVCV